MATLKGVFQHRRKLLLGWIVLEVASIPAAAQMVDKVAFSNNARVIVADARNKTPGVKSYLVSSNTAFVVEVGGTVGNVKVNVASHGYIGSLAYGENAQMPGKAKSCVRGRLGTVEAYRSKRKTAARRGSVQTQAVRVNVSHDPLAEPIITIRPAKQSESVPGLPCQPTRMASL